jgi:hypothetical protein
MSENRQSGGCKCGAIRYVAEGEPLWTAFCHCESCRRASGAPMVAWIGFPTDRVEWQTREPERYHSSPGVTRTFCPECGTPLTFAGERWPGELHVLAATLDDPGRVRMQAHVYWRERLPWVVVGDDLPKFEGTGSEGREQNA